MGNIFACYSAGSIQVSKSSNQFNPSNQFNKPTKSEIKLDITDNIESYNNDDWSPHNFNTTEEFSLNGKYLVTRVVDIYDGDTCTCVLNIFGNYYKFTIRLAEIDTCEMKSKNSETKNLANKARLRLYELITKTSSENIDQHISRKELRDLLNCNTYLIKILCGEFDKYGRLLGSLFDISENVKPNDMSKSFNHILIREKLAYEYKGDTKLTEKQQIECLKK
jgi:endonuclease YncB( thermonuclease family)